MTTKIDIRSVPWSRSGSWMSIAAPSKPEHQPLGPGICLRNHHGRGVARREVFLTEPVAGRRIVRVDVEARPDWLAANTLMALGWYEEAIVEFLRVREAFSTSDYQKRAVEKIDACRKKLKDGPPGAAEEEGHK